MPSERPVTRDAFLCLAARAGLDEDSAHMEELYPLVESTLAGLDALNEIDVQGAEPDMAFIPPGAYWDLRQER